jgi:4-hydroxybenzoate polyprenyltransferase
VRACHPLPSVAVTFVMSAFAWSIGWRGSGLALVALAVLVGQLSVGWSNDAFDSRIDAAAQRGSKPTVGGLVTPRALWIGAGVAFAVAAFLSWSVAGIGGGSFHVFALAMAWLYNTVLSRTVWSWIPYALAFGAMPAFLSYGLDGTSPAPWAVAVFAIVGVSAHIANALPDIESDAAAGLGGLAVQLGQRRGLVVCWILLGLGSAILFAVTLSERALVAWIVAAAFVVAVIVGAVAKSRSVMFRALLAVVAVDVIALVLAGSLAG